MGDFNGDGLSDMLVVGADNAWVYTSYGNGFGGAMQWSTDGKMTPNGYGGYTYPLTRTGDFNGDGLTDVISVNPQDGKAYVWISNGSGFDFHPDWFPNGGFCSRFDLADLNGDGMTDVIKISGSNQKVYFSTGSGFQYRPEYNQAAGCPTIPAYDHHPAMWDIAGDGRGGFQSINDNKVWLSSGSGFPYFLAGPSHDDKLGDFNGDGFADVIDNGLRVSLWNGNGYIDCPWWNGNGLAEISIPPADFLGCGKTQVSVNDFTNGDHVMSVYVPKDPTKEDIITSITDGLGKQVSVTYKPLTDPTVYQKNNDAMYPIIRDYQGPMYVVSGFTVTDGIGGVNSYNYTYAGARIDTARGELLGFQSTTVKDLQTNLSTTSTYLQGFPFGGLLKSRTVFLINGANTSIVSEITNDYNVQCYDSSVLTETKSEDQASEWFIYNSPGVPSRSYFPYLAISLKEDYALTGSSTPITTSEEDYSYFDYGNLQKKVTNIATKTGSKTTDTCRQTDTFQYYTSDFTNWIIGLVSQQTSQGRNNLGVTETRTMSYQYDTTHRLLTQDITEPTGSQGVKLTRDYEYFDAYFNNTKITESGYNGTAPESRITTFSYNYDAVEFHITKTNLPSGLQEIYDYDWATGKATTYTDPNLNPTDWYYDDFGRLKEEDRPDGTKTIYTYTIGGPGTGAVYNLKTQVFDSNNIVLAPATTSFDKLDREIYQETQAQNGQILFKNTSYNKRGLVDTKSRYHFSGGNAQSTSFIYDALGRATSQTAYNSGITTYAYNISGYNNTSVTNAKSQTTAQTSNAIGKLCKVVDPQGKTIFYAYTPFGDLNQVKDSLNNTTNLTYDIRGRRSQVQDPDMGTWNYTYNAFGDLVSQTDPRGNVIQMTYDMLSRIKTKTSGGQAYSWIYDTATNGKGNPASVSGPAYQETYTYDNLGRSQDVSTMLDGTTYTVTNSYDAYSRLSRITYPSSGSSRVAVGYQYTANGYLQSVKDVSSRIVYWTANARNALDQATQEGLGNGLTTTNTFDAATGRLTGISTSGSVQSLTYTYDAIGNLNSRKNNLKNLTETFTYDAANRLTAVTGPQNKTYSYNEVGNILNKSDVGAYTYGSSRPHAVTSAGGINYTYDANGNIISDSSGRSITFDGFNRPAQLAKTGASGTLTYDAYDALVKQILTQGSTTTTTIYLGSLFEKVTTGSVTDYKHYILAEGRQVAIYDYRNDGTYNTYYLHKDHLGSTDVTTNALGNVVDNLSYDPFGMRRNATTWQDQAGITCNTTDVGYTGHIQLDIFGLVHMGARIYDAKLGRFISPDNVVQNMMNSQCLNRYSYCLNNPLRYVDPSGHSFLGSICKAVVKVVTTAVVAVVVATAVVASLPTGTTPLLVGVLAGAAGGAAAGATSVALNGGSPSDVLKGAAIGAVAGGITGGILGAVGVPNFQPFGNSETSGFASITNHLFNTTLTGSVFGAGFAAVNGDNVLQGAERGAIDWAAGEAGNMMIGNAIGYVEAGKGPEFRNGAFYYDVKGGGLFTIGGVIIGDNDNLVDSVPQGDKVDIGHTLEQHELGHFPQQTICGPLYAPLNLISQGLSGSIGLATRQPLNATCSERFWYNTHRYNPFERCFNDVPSY